MVPFVLRTRGGMAPEHQESESRQLRPPHTRGDGSLPKSLRKRRGPSPAHARGWLPVVLFFCHPFLLPRMSGGQRGAEPCAGDRKPSTSVIARSPEGATWQSP